ETRIKIYTKDGYDWGNKAVRYYSAVNPTEKVTFSKAVTYNLVNGAIEKTKLKSDGEFDEQANKYWSVKKIAMPNVKEGSVIEYKYAIRSPYTSNFPLWSFQSTVPVNYSKFVTRIPEYYVYRTNVKGSVALQRQETLQKRSYNYTTKDRYTNGRIVGTDFNSEKVEFNESITTYIAEKVPSMKDEAYVSNISNYTSSIEHELSVLRFPNQPIKSLSTTWDDVVKNIYESTDFGGEIKKNGYFEDDLKTITAGLTSNDAKMMAIYLFVKNRMNWNNYYGYNCDGGVKKAYKDKVGNVAEINLMLIAMLRAAGIDANPILVSTRDNGIPFFPNRTAYNYVICAVEVQDAVIMLDATDKQALPNILPIRALNWIGRIIRPNGSSAEMNLMPHFNSKDVVNIIGSLDSSGKVSGKLRDQYFDYNAFLYRRNYAGVAKESYLEKLEKRLEGIEIGEYNSTMDDFSKPVVENFSFTHNRVSEIIGDKMYFAPLLFLTSKENPFKQEKREYPVDFIFPKQDKYTITMTIPDGFAVESLPAPAAVSMGDLGKFTFNISSAGKQIQVAVSVDINESIVSSEDYQMLKDFYKSIIDKENEKIVLKKI
ncbi:MAG: DUF3857 domain-containing protein, partial [Flavobacterium sp.]